MRPDRRRRGLLAVPLALATTRAGAATVDTAAQTTLGPGAELGFAAMDLATGHVTAANPDLRLPMCSSFKWLLAAAVLQRVDGARDRLDRRLAFGPRALVFNSPACEAALKRAGGERAELSLADLCEAMVTLSDSAAANLLLDTVGGPAGLTRWLRREGDAVTLLDRYELDLNRVPAGDPRDTTTAAAMLGDLRRFLYGPRLSPGGRGRLLEWMLAAKPGPARLPAGAPPSWRTAHKTGTWRTDGPSPDGVRNASGDVGALIPPEGAPVLVAAYTAGSRRPQAQVDAWFADVARLVTTDALSLRSPRRG